MKAIGICSICHKEILEGEEAICSLSADLYRQYIELNNSGSYHQECVNRKNIQELICFKIVEQYHGKEKE